MGMVAPYFVLGVFVFGLCYGLSLDQRDGWMEAGFKVFFSLLCGVFDLLLLVDVGPA